MADRTLIVDWDGTITERDSLLMVLEQFGDWEECERLGVELFAGKITLREEIERQFATVTAPLNSLGEKELCPGSTVLERFNASLR